jgi:hypothetical protein
MLERSGLCDDVAAAGGREAGLRSLPRRDWRPRGGLRLGASLPPRSCHLGIERIWPTGREAVQRITGRSVIGYHSQIVFNPERAFEIFVLDRPRGGVGLSTVRPALVPSA